MRQTSLMLFGCVLLLCSCNRDQAAEEPSPTPKGETFEAQFRGLSEPARNFALRNAIRDSGLHCERVEESHFQEKVKTAGMWVANCTDSGAVAVFVGSTGYAQIRRCEDLVGADAPKCRTTAQ